MAFVSRGYLMVGFCVAFGCQAHDYKIVSMSENVSQKHRSSPEKGYGAIVNACPHASKTRTLQDLEVTYNLAQLCQQDRDPKVLS